jgi:hypothetical protein
MCAGEGWAQAQRRLSELRSAAAFAGPVKRALEAFESARADDEAWEIKQVSPRAPSLPLSAHMCRQRRGSLRRPPRCSRRCALLA